MPKIVSAIWSLDPTYNSIVDKHHSEFIAILFTFILQVALASS